MLAGGCSVIGTLYGNGINYNKNCHLHEFLGAINRNLVTKFVSRGKTGNIVSQSGTFGMYPFFIELLEHT